MQHIAKILQQSLPFVWLGAVLSISFMEAPLKFNAPNLTMPVALEVGHIVFDALNKAEWVMALLLIFTVVLSRPGRLALCFFGAILFVLLLQTFWLFPILDERTLAIIAGKKIPASNFHLLYIVFEIVKIFLLGIFGVLVLREENEKS